MPTPPGQPQAADTILVVDDDDAVRSIIARALRGAGYQVVEASDGMKAAAAYSAHAERIVAATVDLAMPDTNGRELLAMIGARESGLPVVIVSGALWQSSQVQTGGRRRTEYVAKPFQPEAVVQAVRRAIAERPAR